MNVISQFPAAREYSHDLQFQAVFEGAAVGIAVCHLEGRILETNSALRKMLGYSENEILGVNVFEFYPELRHKASSDNRHAGLPGRESRQSRGVPGESTHGKAGVGELAFAELMRGERPAVESEQRYGRKDGTAFWGHLTLSVARDGGGHPALLIAMLADASERKQIEEHLREAEKMEVIGRLAGGIAHDFNNLLTGILLYCDLVSAGLENIGSQKRASPIAVERRSANHIKRATAELVRHVDEVRRAGEQGAAMTQQLLAIARKRAADPRPIAINETVTSTENLLRRLIGEQIELVVSRDSRLDGAMGLVLADPAQLRQILLNLVLNARDALPQGGKIILNTRMAEFPDHFAGHAPDRHAPDRYSPNRHSPDRSPNHFPSNGGHHSAPAGGRRAIAVAVIDNGCGMNEETRARLFEPFFTTKGEGEGTGLGLATVQRIINESGGTIKVDSEPGRGTSIEVFFPSTEVSAEVSAKASAIAMSVEGTRSLEDTRHEVGPKTILLVDDHASARRSMQCLLLEAGYRVLEAASPQQAIQLFAEQSHKPDLMIADFMMPGMSGPELGEALRRHKPDLKILLVSGYEEAPVGAGARAVELIRKPFSGRTLIDRVVEVMHRQVG
jgi:two-component system, cell cycle sensor histidine kinase and response regulator CckA